MRCKQMKEYADNFGCYFLGDAMGVAEHGRVSAASQLLLTEVISFATPRRFPDSFAFWKVLQRMPGFSCYPDETCLAGDPFAGDPTSITPGALLRAPAAVLVGEDESWWDYTAISTRLTHNSQMAVTVSLLYMAMTKMAMDTGEVPDKFDDLVVLIPEDWLLSRMKELKEITATNLPDTNAQTAAEILWLTWKLLLEHGKDPLKTLVIAANIQGNKRAVGALAGFLLPFLNKERRLFNLISPSLPIYRDSDAYKAKKVYDALSLIQAFYP